ncbi:RrF2 family transcriptional regulator [Metaclostridioides mangenotii]|uniref:RrF2 family transcriptional regulator n=1 Tax=Metaclostridioides mangenotii TaxID=1540 RepID=UPI00046346EA|nr:Rrf2 family transcriptional regulator [Clostridioides mangenotii]
MQFSIGIEYALHSLFYILDLPKGTSIGIKELANLHQVSETYLSKIFTKLRKQGIVRSVPGVKGGYELAKEPENISFWDVVEAVEGTSYLFQCKEIRKNNQLFNEEQKDSNSCNNGDPCLIKVVMWEAEEQMRNYLRKKNLLWLRDEVYSDFSKDKKEKINTWIKNR